MQNVVLEILTTIDLFYDIPRWCTPKEFPFPVEGTI